MNKLISLIFQKKSECSILVKTDRTGTRDVLESLVTLFLKKKMPTTLKKLSYRVFSSRNMIAMNNERATILTIFIMFESSYGKNLNRLFFPHSIKNLIQNKFGLLSEQRKVFLIMALYQLTDQA